MYDDKHSVVSVALHSIYYSQKDFQEKVIEKYGYKGLSSEGKISLPIDNVDVAQYHMTAMIEEIGELVKSDKRWKNYRNTHYDKENKLEELADCFITLINIALFSGISYDELVKAIFNKIEHNKERIEK